MVKKLFYFRGGRKSEEISVNEKVYHLGVGDIISDIMDINMEQFLNDTALLEEGVLLPVAMGDKSYQELKKLPWYISGLKVSPIIKEILLWQPLFAAQVDAFGRQAELEFTTVERRQHDSGSPPIYQNQQLVGLGENSAICWDVFCGLFGKAHPMSISSVKDQKIIYECASIYLENYRKMLLTFQRLRNNLADWIQRDRLLQEAKNDLIYAGLRTHFVAYGEVNQIFPEKSGIKYNQIQRSVRINDLVALEIDLMCRSDQRFRKCELCGRYFVPFSPKSIYCHHENTVKEFQWQLLPLFSKPVTLDISAAISFFYLFHRFHFLSFFNSIFSLPSAPRKALSSSRGVRAVFFCP